VDSQQDMPRSDQSSDAAKGHVFVSHGKADSWVASQLALRIRECGPSTFLDETDIAKGDSFKKRIYEEIEKCTELIALFTPWSINRNWVWIEIGAAWGQGKRVLAVLYEVTESDLKDQGGTAILEDINLLELNRIDEYFNEVKERYQP
jgi:hypothetical protein